MPAGFAKLNSRKMTTRSVSVSDGYTFSDALRKPLQREFGADNHPRSGSAFQSADTGTRTEIVEQGFINKNLQNDDHTNHVDSTLGKVVTSTGDDEQESTGTKDASVSTVVLPMIMVVPSMGSASAVRSETGLTENVVRVDELSSLMIRLSGQSPQRLQDSNENSPVDTLLKDRVTATLKTPTLTAAGQWTVHLMDQSQALNSIRLQLDSKGQWHIALDMKMHTAARTSGAIAQDLQARLAKSGHRITKLTLHESATDSDASDD